MAPSEGSLSTTARNTQSNAPSRQEPSAAFKWIAVGSGTRPIPQARLRFLRRLGEPFSRQRGRPTSGGEAAAPLPPSLPAAGVWGRGRASAPAQRPPAGTAPRRPQAPPAAPALPPPPPRALGAPPRPPPGAPARSARGRRREAAAAAAARAAGEESRPAVAAVPTPARSSRCCRLNETPAGHRTTSLPRCLYLPSSPFPHTTQTRGGQPRENKLKKKQNQRGRKKKKKTPKHRRVTQASHRKTGGVGGNGKTKSDPEGVEGSGERREGAVLPKLKTSRIAL